MAALHHQQKGRSNAAIADSLLISNSAVEKHISSILDPLALPPGERDTHRRVAAVLAFLENREIERKGEVCRLPRPPR